MVHAWCELGSNTGMICAQLYYFLSYLKVILMLLNRVEQKIQNMLYTRVKKVDTTVWCWSIQAIFEKEENAQRIFGQKNETHRFF